MPRIGFGVTHIPAEAAKNPVASTGQALSFRQTPAGGEILLDGRPLKDADVVRLPAGAITQLVSRNLDIFAADVLRRYRDAAKPKPKVIDKKVIRDEKGRLIGVRETEL